MNDRAGRENGLSDALGAIVLISVVALGITVAGVAILSSPLPGHVPALNAEVTNTSDAVLIRHTGGDTLVQGEYRILADGVDRTADFLYDGALPSRWGVGDTLRYEPDSAPMPALLQIVSSGGQYGQVILELRVQPAAPVPIYTWYPTVTFSPTGTPGPVHPPSADFTGYPLAGGAPLSVQFADTSTNTPTTWGWAFGDGGTSGLQNPAHTYLSAGNYTVSLTVTNADGSSTATKAGYIMVYALLSASFNWRDIGHYNVRFTDTSTGGATSWSWDFGDGTSATQQKINHKYPAPGQYNVSLTVTRISDGAGSTARQVITVV